MFHYATTFHCLINFPVSTQKCKFKQSFKKVIMYNQATQKAEPYLISIN